MGSVLLAEIANFDGVINRAVSNGIAKKKSALSFLFDPQTERSLDLFKGQAGAALLEHFFYTCYHHANNNELYEIGIINHNLSTISKNIQKSSNFIPIVFKDDCKYNSDSAFLSPIYLYDFQRCPMFKTGALDDAIAIVKAAGFWDFVSQTVGLVVVMDERSGNDHLESYTVTALYGTIFMDLYQISLIRTCDLKCPFSHSD